MITDDKNICLFVFAADCVPILMFDPVKKVIAAIHSGWAGTVKKIACETVFAMQKNFGSNIDDIVVGIGPSISPENYEVGQNVVDEVLKSFGTTEKYMFKNTETGKFHFDIWYTNKKMLLDVGIKEKNIEVGELCTFAEDDLFFSARRDEPTGRFGAGITLI